MCLIGGKRIEIKRTNKKWEPYWSTDQMEQFMKTTLVQFSTYISKEQFHNITYK